MCCLLLCPDGQSVHRLTPDTRHLGVALHGAGDPVRRLLVKGQELSRQGIGTSERSGVDKFGFADEDGLERLAAGRAGGGGGWCDDLDHGRDNGHRFLILGVSLALSSWAGASRLEERAADAHEKFLAERRLALPSLMDPFGVPAKARLVLESGPPRGLTSAVWKRNVIATVFWVGELPGNHNPTPNTRSAWDSNWVANFGGYDDPDQRAGYQPAQFTPLLNPFYVALPYNDVTKIGGHRPEANEVIPWFWQRFRGNGISVCKDRWLAVHHQGRVCYAQWEDVGPFQIDHWQYVFGNDAPLPNRNGGAGIDLSPAVRDFLQLRSGATVEWRFVEDSEVPHGPWLRKTKIIDNVRKP